MYMNIVQLLGPYSYSIDFLSSISASGLHNYLYVGSFFATDLICNYYIRNHMQTTGPTHMTINFIIMMV